MTPALSAARLARRGLAHFRRSHAPAGLGVAVATAVLTGALVVGDSVRGSLRGLTLERLGRYTHAVAPRRPFRAELGGEIVAREGFAERFSAAVNTLSSPASLSARVDDQNRRASGVTLHGVDPAFWDGSGFAPSEGLMLTRGVATELGVEVGDELIVRVGVVSALPADSPLGEKTDTTASLRVRLDTVLPDAGLARFGLRPSQRPPRNAFLPLDRVQRLLDLQGRSGAILFASENEADDADAWLTDNVTPRAADYGLTLDEVRPGLWQVESEQLVLDDAVVTGSREAFGDAVETITTYLANTTRVGDRSVPYSTVAGVRRAPGRERELADDEIVLNSWAANDLQAAVGDAVTLTFYEPESTHGVLREADPVTLRLAAIVELETPTGVPTAAADPRLTPRLPGVTNADAIGDWDLPFELVEPIRRQDEDYWDEHSTTPKAFVAESLAVRLWATRWGETSLVRIATDAPREEIEARLLAALDPADFGFTPLAVQREGLAASSGSTPFDVLFLLFSLFLIAAAAMLIVLLTRLAVDGRAGEAGLMGALGWSPRRATGQLLREQMVVVALGAVAGAAVGIAYAALLLYLLGTVWVDAIVTPFLSLHVRPTTVALGGLAGVAIGYATARLAIAAALRRPPRALLAGSTSDSPAARSTPAAWPVGVSLAVVATATLFGATQTGEAAAGAFFAAGGGVLAAALLGLRRRLAFASQTEGVSLPRMALRNVARNPGRSLLIVGLVAAAAFLILATSAFRLPPTAAGAGGFELVATTDTPLHFDLATPDGRFELGLGDADEAVLTSARVFGFRRQPGEDASCQNLYQATQPRVLGVPDGFIENLGATQNGFAWAAVAPGFEANPWAALRRSSDASSDTPTPVVLDFNTAVYALKLYGGVGSRLTIDDERGRGAELEVVGLLKNSVLQGELLLGEADFLRLFPSVSGSSYFLVGGLGDRVTEASAMLEDRLSDVGFDAEETRVRLAGFLAVQNTYLSTFQALGALGLLLGAVGLAVGQFRNLAERRGELALLRAAGFARARVRRMVLLENAALLAGGLAIGALAAIVALAPLAATQDARPPWLVGAALLASTAAIGLVAGRIAAGRALAAPITPALRGD